MGTVTDPLELHASRYMQHPSAIDQCLQLIGIAVSSGLPHRIARMYIPTTIESIFVGKGAAEMTVEVKTRDGMRNGQIGDAIGIANGQTCFSMKGGFLFGADDPVVAGAAAIHLASKMDWKPAIDLLPVESLLPAPPRLADYEDYMRAGGLLALLYIAATATRIQHAQSDQIHLMKWKAWLLSETAKMAAGQHEGFLQLANWAENVQSTNSSVLFAKKVMRAFEAVADQNQQVLYLGSPQWTQVDPVRSIEILEQTTANAAVTPDDVIIPYLRDIFSLSLDFMSGERLLLETLMGNDRWEAFHEFPSLHTDWSVFLPLLCHNNPALRILEIGAVTGFATKKALSNLKSPTGVRMYSRYVFTDVSPGFMAKAQEKFRDEENIEYQTLDIGQAPVEQGFEPHSFDLIIASNVCPLN